MATKKSRRSTPLFDLVTNKTRDGVKAMLDQMDGKIDVKELKRKAKLHDALKAKLSAMAPSDAKAYLEEFWDQFYTDDECTAYKAGYAMALTIMKSYLDESN